MKDQVKETAEAAKNTVKEAVASGPGKQILGSCAAGAVCGVIVPVVGPVLGAQIGLAIGVYKAITK